MRWTHQMCIISWLNKFQPPVSSRSPHKPYVSVLPLVTLPFFLSLSLSPSSSPVSLCLCVSPSLSVVVVFGELILMCSSSPSLRRCCGRWWRGDAVRNKRKRRRRDAAEQAGDAATATVETPPCAAFRGSL